MSHISFKQRERKRKVSEYCQLIAGSLFLTAAFFLAIVVLFQLEAAITGAYR